jgi:hypothetical protein
MDQLGLHPSDLRLGFLLRPFGLLLLVYVLEQAVPANDLPVLVTSWGGPCAILPV